MYAGFVLVLKTKWVSALVDSIVLPSKLMCVDGMAEQESDFSNIYLEDKETKTCSTEDVIKWLITELGKMDPKAFTLAATTLGMMVDSVKLAVEEFMAMADEAILD